MKVKDENEEAGLKLNIKKNDLKNEDGFLFYFFVVIYLFIYLF